MVAVKSGTEGVEEPLQPTLSVELPVAAATLTDPPQGVTEEFCVKDAKGVGEVDSFIDLEVVIVTLSSNDWVPYTGVPELQPEKVGGTLPLAL